MTTWMRLLALWISEISYRKNGQDLGISWMWQLVKRCAEAATRKVEVELGSCSNRKSERVKRKRKLWKKNMVCVEEKVGCGNRLLPVEGLDTLVRKARVNAFVEVKWRLSRGERNSNGYFTLHIPCFECLMHHIMDKLVVQQKNEQVTAQFGWERWEMTSLSLLPVGAA